MSKFRTDLVFALKLFSAIAGAGCLGMLITWPFVGIDRAVFVYQVVACATGVVLALVLGFSSHVLKWVARRDARLDERNLAREAKRQAANYTATNDLETVRTNMRRGGNRKR